MSCFLTVLYHYAEVRRGIQDSCQETTVFNYGLRAFFDANKDNFPLPVCDDKQKSVDSMNDLIHLSILP